MRMKQVFDFNDITLLPQFSYVESRSECDTKIKFGNHTFKSPVVPANMESIIDVSLAVKLSEKGYFYILHRFDIDEVSFVKTMKDMGLISSISVGVNEDSYRLIDELVSKDLEPDFITIDIAHGHSIKMKKMVHYIKNRMMNTFLIGGNVCTPEAVNDLTEWGCDAIKCGIGGGSACTTYHSTGFGNRGWQASMIEQCSKVSKVPIIADGSIKEHCDIVKSLVLGASMVMVGGMLSGYIDSPGEKVKNVIDGKWYKEFWGSASSHQSGKTNRIEGIKKLVQFKESSVFDKLKEVEESIQSAISYGGGNPSTIECLLTVEFVIK
jgi:GMP reductase